MATSSAVTEEGRVEHGCLDNAVKAGAAPSIGEGEGEGKGKGVSQAELVAQKEVVEAGRCADVDRARGEPESSPSPIRNTTSVQHPPEKVAALTGGDAIPSDDTPSDATLEGSSGESGEGSKPLPSTEVVAAMAEPTAEGGAISTSVESPTAAKRPAAAEVADEEVPIDEEVHVKEESGLGQPANGAQEKREVGAISPSHPACETGELHPPLVDPVNDEGGNGAPSIAMGVGDIGEQAEEKVGEVLELPSPAEIRTDVSSVHTEPPAVESGACKSSGEEREEDVREGSSVEERPPSPPPPPPPLLCSNLPLADATKGDFSSCQSQEGDKSGGTTSLVAADGSLEHTTKGDFSSCQSHEGRSIENKEVGGQEKIDRSSVAEMGVVKHAVHPLEEAESELEERADTSGGGSMAASTNGIISGEGGDRPPAKSDESANANEKSTAELLSSGDEKSEETKVRASVNGGGEEEGSTSPPLSHVREEEDGKGVNDEPEREQAEDGGYAGDVDGTLSRSRHVADVNGTGVGEDDGEDARNELNSSGDESGGSSEWSSGAEWEDENGDFNDDSGDELGLKSSSKGKKAKKKKKKKKKKKSRDVDGGCVPSSCSDDLSLPSEMADLRYNSALEELKTEKVSLWVQLSRCRIGDKKVKRLSDALRGNGTVTSIDLSDNRITDDGIKVLAGVLAGGSATNLINLDVRGNHLSSAGLAALKSLQGLRKLVKVEYGDSMLRKYEDGPENGNGDLSTAGGKENRANGWVDDAHERLLASSAEDWTEETVREGLQRPVPSLNEWAAVEQVEGALKAVAESAECLNVGHLTAQITNVLRMIDQELREAPTRSILLDKLPRGLALTMANIEKFVSVLDMSPPPRLMQNREVMPTAGRHRIVVVELLSRLVMYGLQEIDQKIVLAGAVRKVVDLMFSHPLCSILHGQASHFLEALLARPNSSLCSHALEGTEGLPTQLAKAGRECADTPIGKRPGYCGHVVVLCTAVENVGHINSNVRSILEKNEDWFRFTAPGGALGKLVKEQCGGLGGPRPQFPMSCLFDGGSAQAAVDQLRALFLG